MNELTWEKICGRAHQFDKTVICEVSKKIRKRYFKVKCNICGDEKEASLQGFEDCKVCSNNKRKFTTEDFIKKSISIHGSKYNYDLVEYVRSDYNVKIKCNDCENIFLQAPNSHLRGVGCKVCARSNRKFSIEDFICLAKQKHGDKYNYDLVEYSNAKAKVTIKCNKCKLTFSQRAQAHLSGQGCRICSNNRLKDDVQSFILKSVAIHENKYNYDLVEYVGAHIPVKIFCNTCNDFFDLRPADHLQGVGCKKCATEKNAAKLRYSTEDFIVKARQKHGDKYNYDLVEYVSSRIPIKIKCLKCNNIFEQAPQNHLQGNGCFECKEFKGEIKILNYLKSINVNFKRQQTFKGLKNKKSLRYDFYLPDYNRVIEYDGEGHYLPVFGQNLEDKQKSLERTQICDQIKNEYAIANNISMLRIPYWDYDRIEELIDAFILV